MQIVCSFSRIEIYDKRSERKISIKYEKEIISQNSKSRNT